MKYVKIILISLFFSLTIIANDKVMPSIVSVKWLKSHIDDPRLVIIDVRKKSTFVKGHIRHAVNLPVFKYLFDKNLYLPKLSFLKKVFSDAGIDDKSLVVVYGNDEPIWAARFYWISKVLGHDKVGLLKVSYGNWKKGELPTSKSIYTPMKTNFIPMVDNSILQTKLSVYMSLGKKIIIDGRGKEFFEGIKSHAKRFGHIPTAVNYPGSLCYDKNDSGSVIKNLKELEKLYKDLPKNKDIILYCEDGADAAMNFLVLQKLGYKVSVYDGSWLEWGNDTSLPIVNPSKK